MLKQIGSFLWYGTIMALVFTVVATVAVLLVLIGGSYLLKFLVENYR